MAVSPLEGCVLGPLVEVIDPKTIAVLPGREINDGKSEDSGSVVPKDHPLILCVLGGPSEGSIPVVDPTDDKEYFLHIPEINFSNN